MKKRYEIAILLVPYDIPDVIYITDSYLDCVETLKIYEKNNPRQRYAWREVYI